MKKNLFMLLMLIGCMSASAQQGFWNFDEFVELTPDESVVYRYVEPMDGESEKTLNDLYDKMEETGDESILKRSGGGVWYVRNDYPLPEGDFYESPVYRSSEGYDLVVRPGIGIYLKSGFQIDGLLEDLGGKVRVDIYEDDNPEKLFVRYVLACNVRTSDEVLEIIKTMHDFGLGEMTHYFAPLLWTFDSAMMSKLTGADEDSEGGGGSGLIAEVDWTVEELYMGCVGEVYSGDPTYYTVEGVGLIINSNPADGAAYWEPMVPMIGNIPELKKGGHYLVKFTIDTPAAGEIRLDFCSWDGSGATMAQIINVKAGEKEYAIDFFDYPTTCTDGMIFYQCGHIPGQHIIKKVQVYKIVEGFARGHETTIHVVKAEKTDKKNYNLSGQKVDASYKGVVIQNGKKFMQK